MEKQSLSHLFGVSINTIYGRQFVNNFDVTCAFISQMHFQESTLKTFSYLTPITLDTSVEGFRGWVGTPFPNRVPGLESH